MKNRKLFHIPTIVLAIMLLISSAQAAVITGTIITWHDGEAPVLGSLRINYGDNHMFIPWTSNFSIENPLAYFYGSKSFTSLMFAPNDYLTDVAFATGVTDISQITDASIFSFTDSYMSGSPYFFSGDYNAVSSKSGDFIVMKNIFTGNYAALRIDSLVSNNSYSDGLYLRSILTGTWWLQTDGTGNFSFAASPVPEPSMFMLLSIGMLALPGYHIYRKRNKLASS
ncbi:MAG: PEP-CTERM sorting domain-containing protein [Proteobacteria bacterium]|nr:PEP-CTERM sorting domain-containing protein [Pseudomonadota bacterium]